MSDRARRVRAAVAAELVLARAPLSTEDLVHALVARPRIVSARYGTSSPTEGEVRAAIADLHAAGSITPATAVRTGTRIWLLSRPCCGRRAPVPRPRTAGP